MKKRSGEYWEKRFKHLEESQHDKSVQTTQSIEQQFQHAEQVLDGKINAWYHRFATNNGMSMVEAKRLLNSEELEEFHWNVQEYIKYGKNNAVSQQWEQQLENASAKVHISRLEALKLQCQQEAEILYGNYHDTVDQHIAEAYRARYYHTAYEIAKGTGIGVPIQSFNSTLVNDIIHKPWAVDGVNFSQRIWTDKTKLVNTLQDSLTRMCITGEAPDRAIREVKHRLKVSRSQAARIVQTEAAAFSARAQQDCFKKLDIEEFEVVETLDSITCDTCGAMDSKHYPMSEFVIGVTAPPFHPNCRGCTCPYFNDEFTTDEKRVYRAEDGSEKYVSSNMTYEEWKKRYLTHNNKAVGEDIDIPRLEPENENEPVFDRNNVKKQIEALRTESNINQTKLAGLEDEEKILTQKCYFDMTGTPEEMNRLRSVADEKRKLRTEIERNSADLLEKQMTYKSGVEKEILDSGILKEIKLSGKMTPETVDEIESVLYELNSKYGKMPEGVIFNPAKVGDGTAAYNWLDDKLYLSNKICDSRQYKEFVQQAEDSLKEYREHYQIAERAKKDIEEAGRILDDKNIKGYEREKARIQKARAEIALNTTKQAERENISDVITHEYGHFIHRHANEDYVQKKNVYGAKELGGKMIGGDWKYDINTQHSTQGMINASKISKYATESPYETFAEGFLALDKGEKIPEPIENIIKSAMKKAGVDNIDKISNDAIIKLSDEEMGAIMQYKSFDSYKINDALRNTDDIAKLTSDEQKFIKVLDQALSKTPTYSGELIRTVNFSDHLDASDRVDQFVADYMPGKIISIPQYWSTSKKNGYDPNAEIFIYIEDSKMGHDISSIGLDESEVLYDRDKRFKVVDKAFKDEKWYILLEEVN